MDQIEVIRKKQLKMALGVGIPYFAFVIGIFLLVYLAGEAVAQISLMGFPLHYWLVAIAIYPITWGPFHLVRPARPTRWKTKSKKLWEVTRHGSRDIRYP